MKQEAAVKTEYGNQEWSEVGKGVRQGCILSPYLFNMYSEHILRRVGFEDNIGIKTAGRTINNLWYADDTTILTEDKEDMRKLLKKAKGRAWESWTDAEPKEDPDNDNRDPNGIHFRRKKDGDNKLLHIFRLYNYKVVQIWPGLICV